MRMNQFVPKLVEAGAAVRIAPFFDDAYLHALFGRGARPGRSAVAGHARRLRTLIGPGADLVWLEKELFPFLPGVAERALQWRGLAYVVDYDDAVFHRYDRHPSRLVRRVFGDKLRPLIAGAAAVTAGNEYLADYARTRGARRVEIVPTVVDPAAYPVTAPPAGPSLRIGWIGTPANARYLATVADALRLLGDAVPATLVTIGAPALPDLPVPQEAHPWSEDTEGALLASCDVGVMPLRDSSYERGKCGYKLIQCMAAARPVIASPVGANRGIVTPDVGILAETAPQWADAIQRLADDPGLRARMGAAGRARVEAHYSKAVAGRAIVALFAGLLGPRA